MISLFIFSVTAFSWIKYIMKQAIFLWKENVQLGCATSLPSFNHQKFQSEIIQALATQNASEKKYNAQFNFWYNEIDYN